ncbi:hypothetical protein B0I37DRAFT_217218 [Chaetomium sp. MPI-CAGE-AT-0009]|nr:hypothetical protein B0I37DRAFT_217218 [Chaetomium sp. MPI-CAGE-AT-0009]
MGFSLKWITRDEKVRKAAFEIATKYAKQAGPIVQTIEAGLRAYKAKGMLGDINTLASNVNSAVTTAKHFIPSMQVMGGSLADSAKIFVNFNLIATAAGIGANIVQTYQGIKVLQLIDARLKDMATSLAAQTALIAQKDFPPYVHGMIRERVTQTSLDPACDHWFFVYHPDNDWYPGFYHLLEKEPIGPAFCGYTNQIDTAFVFMLAARRQIEKKERRAREDGRPIRPTRLHLLIPAYQPILILEALKIPEEIGDFVMEGRINSNTHFVWLNLPEDQRHYVQDIGHFAPPNPGWFSWFTSGLGLTERPPKLGEPRVLGTRQGSAEGDEKSVDIAADVRAEEGEETREEKRHSATPLQHRYRRRRGKRDGDHSEGRGRRRHGESGRESNRSARDASVLETHAG